MLTKRCILILLYNYIVYLHEMTLWCIGQFVYAGILNF
jgi:hypothetical protein